MSHPFPRPTLCWSLLGLVLAATCSLAAPKAGDFFASGPTDRKAIALSFDDGPGPWTDQFLDLLDQHGVKATFFMEAEQVRFRGALAKKVRDRGHEIGTHTLKHTNYLKRFNELKKEALLSGKGEQPALEQVKSELRADLQKSREIIEEATQSKLTLCRMPHGIDRPWIHDVAKETGFVLVNWTYGADWTPQSAADLESPYVKAVKPGAILLFHDGGKAREKSLKLTEAVLKAAKEKGFEIVPIGQMIGLSSR